MSDKEKRSSRVNLIASLVVGVVTLLSLMFLHDEPPKKDSNPKPTLGATSLQSSSVLDTPKKSEVPAPTELDAEMDRLPNEAAGPIPEQALPPMYEEGTKPDLQLPPDLQQQMNSPAPELPADLREQLESPPPPLPPDLESQLNTTTPELPEDIQRALTIPPRIVTAEEVNTPPE